MAPRKANDDTAQAAEQIYALAKADADQQLTEMRESIEAIREESFGMGALHAIDANIAYNEFLKAMTLYRIKQAKEYRKGGMTWDAFCEARGLERRTVDRMLDDMRPIFETFSDKMTDFCGMPFSKIRLLGKQLSDNLSEIQGNCLVYGDESIPLTPDHVDDIQALIERIAEEGKAAKEEAEATIRAKDKVLKSKEEVISKQEKELARFEKQVKAKGLSPEEDSLLGKIEQLQVQLNGYALSVENVRDAVSENPYPNAVAGLISLLDNITMRVSAMRETVADVAPLGMIDDGWTPPQVAGQAA